jgi:hypothetical protein
MVVSAMTRVFLVSIYNLNMRTFNFWLAILLILALPLQGLAFASSCAKHHSPQTVHSQAHPSPAHDCEGLHTATLQQDAQNINLAGAEGTCSVCAWCHTSLSISANIATFGSNALETAQIFYTPANYLSPAAAVLDPPPKS